MKFLEWMDKIGLGVPERDSQRWRQNQSSQVPAPDDLSLLVHEGIDMEQIYYCQDLQSYTEIIVPNS